jgi:hypothetical protein
MTEPAKIKAWLTNDWTSPEQLQLMDQMQLANTLSFGENDMTKHGWVVVGEATINVKLIDQKSMMENKIDALKAERNKAVADHVVLINGLDDKIQQLLAITYNPDA